VDAYGSPLRLLQSIATGAWRRIRGGTDGDPGGTRLGSGRRVAREHDIVARAARRFL